MEKHFLADLIGKKPTFRPEPWYNADGDCLVYKMEDVAVIAERVDELLTIYISALDGRPIGFQIKDVRAIIAKFGLEGLMVSAQAGDGGIRSISVSMLLLAAYEEGPKSMDRRKGYAAALAPAQPVQMSIPADQICVARVWHRRRSAPR